MIGALIIKHRLGLSDVETLEQVRENPYLQYFCSFERYQHTAAFAPMLFVKLRKRLSPDRFATFEQAIIDRVETRRPTTDRVPDDPGDTPTTSGQAAAPLAGDSTPDTPAPRGHLVVDANVSEQGIRYPTDVGLLNDARESTEAIVDGLWQALTCDGLVSGRKPRTYRQRARADYLAHSKKRRAARRQQLQYLRRDLGHIDRLLNVWEAHRLGFPLGYRRQRRLWVIREVARQHDQLHRQQAWRIDDRIVSLHQPHVRPIVRGRIGHPVEFGAKFSVALVGGIACVDALRWDACHEAGDLIDQCQAYRARYGTYPAKVLADGTRAIDAGSRPATSPPAASRADAHPGARRHSTRPSPNNDDSMRVRASPSRAQRPGQRGLRAGPHRRTPRRHQPGMDPGNLSGDEPDRAGTPAFGLDSGPPGTDWVTYLAYYIGSAPV